MIPILFENTWISLQTRWILIVIGLIIASRIAVKRLKRRRVNFNLFIEHSNRYLISALFFSRLVHFSLNPDAYFPRFDFRTLRNFISIWDQGLSFWGALFGMGIMLIYSLKKEGEDLLKWFDALSIPILIGLLFGYFGAFMGGIAYGVPTKLPWGILYGTANVKYTVPVHPTQLYFIIAIGLILWAKTWLRNNTEWLKKDGRTTAFLFTSFSFFFTLIDLLRGDDVLILFGQRTTLYIGILSFGLGLFFLYKLREKPNQNE